MSPQPTPIVEVTYRTPECEETLRRLRADSKATPGTAVVLTDVPAGLATKIAADVAELVGLDLYRIDASAIVGRFIGETEKNINRLLARAEASNAMLFFDEADALFGQRTDVDSADDRFSNVEVDYLLQRLEAYAGLMVMVMNTSAAQEKVGASLLCRVRVRYRAS